jgi:hypothetical protein
MPSADALLQHLRSDTEALPALVGLVLDDLLARPVAELVDPEWVAGRVVEGLRASADDTRTEDWVRSQLQGALERADAQQGPLRPRVPGELIGPVKDLLRRPYAPDPVIVRALLDHRAMRSLLRAVLQETLTDFARTVKAAVPQKSPAVSRGRLGNLLGAAQGVASVVGAELERQLESRVTTFLDGAIARSLDLSVERMCAPDFSDEFGAWRADAVEQLLDLPVERYRQELEKLDPDALVSEVAAMLRAVARWDGLGTAVQAGLEATVSEAGVRSARDFLAGSGLEEGWRPHVQALMTERATELVKTEAFEGWLRGVCEAAE